MRMARARAASSSSHQRSHDRALDHALGELEGEEGVLHILGDTVGLDVGWRTNWRRSSRAGRLDVVLDAVRSSSAGKPSAWPLLIAFMVDLPQPLGPQNPWRLPFFMEVALLSKWRHRTGRVIRSPHLLVLDDEHLLGRLVRGSLLDEVLGGILGAISGECVQDFFHVEVEVLDGSALVESLQMYSK